MGGYWVGPSEDEAMQEEHVFVWQAMLDTVPEDLAGRRVLDAGCNRGGFLRLVADRAPVAEGCGYDPAAAAVADARRLAGERPLRFAVGATVPEGWSGFDVAFSHEVLYLLHDLPSHAAAIFDALALGGAYYAVMGVHAGSPKMREWHASRAEDLRLPELRTVDEVMGAFAAAGFVTSAARLAVRFVPGVGHAGDDFVSWLDYYYDQKLLLRFGRPAGV